MPEEEPTLLLEASAIPVEDPENPDEFMDLRVTTNKHPAMLDPMLTAIAVMVREISEYHKKPREVMQLVWHIYRGKNPPKIHQQERHLTRVK